MEIEAALENLAANIEEALVEARRPPSVDPATIGALLKGQEEISSLLKQQNGIVRGHAENIAALMQWHKDHQGVHVKLESEITYVSRKANVFAGTGTLIGGLITWLGSRWTSG
jgi:hydroxyethylthiazole kinase-like sugar kinase family protein